MTSKTRVINQFGGINIPKVFQLFDLVETSAKVFANIIDKPDNPMMFPNSEIGYGNTGRNPFCEEKLIHVNFVKINQDSLRSIRNCPNINDKNTDNKSGDISEKAGEGTKNR